MQTPAATRLTHSAEEVVPGTALEVIRSRGSADNTFPGSNHPDKTRETGSLNAGSNKSRSKHYVNGSYQSFDAGRGVHL